MHLPREFSFFFYNFQGTSDNLQRVLMSIWKITNFFYILQRVEEKIHVIIKIKILYYFFYLTRQIKYEIK